MTYDDSGNPIVGYDDNGNPIPVGKPQASPVKQAPKTQVPKAANPAYESIAQMLLREIARGITPMSDKINNAVGMVTEPLLQESRPMTAGEASAIREGSDVVSLIKGQKAEHMSARDRASKISAARSAQGVQATTAESLFPASEAARRVDMAAGRTPKGGYAEEHPGTFAGDVFSAPIRLGAAAAVHLPRLLTKRFDNEVPENDGRFASYARGFQDWAADPTGLTGSPSSALFLIPGVNAEALVSGAGAKAATMAGETALGKVLARKGLQYIVEHPKSAKTVIRMGEGANQGASGFMMDSNAGGGGGGMGGAAIPAAFGTVFGGSGELLAAKAAQMLPRYQAIIAETQKGVPTRKAVQVGSETDEILRRNLARIGILGALRGVHAISDVAGKDLDRSTNMFEFLQKTMSPRLHEYLQSRPIGPSAAEHYAEGLSTKEAMMLNGRKVLPDDVANEHLIWTGPDKSMIDINDPNQIGPSIPAYLKDHWNDYADKIVDAAHYGGDLNTSDATLAKKALDRLATIKTILNPMQPKAVLDKKIADQFKVVYEPLAAKAKAEFSQDVANAEKILGRKPNKEEMSALGDKMRQSLSDAKHHATVVSQLPQKFSGQASPDAKMYFSDLTAIRRASNKKQGTSVAFNAAQEQNALGSLLGSFATPLMYERNRSLQENGLVPFARKAGKLWKEGQLMQRLSTGDMKETLRPVSNFADNNLTKYTIPLLLHALGTNMSKSGGKLSETYERNR